MLEYNKQPIQTLLFPPFISRYIPYRDSKLTRLLQNSLGGNAKTVLLCMLSPADSNVDESRSTLQFGVRAKKVVNRATVNEAHSAETMLGKYRQEIAQVN